MTKLNPDSIAAPLGLYTHAIAVDGPGRWLHVSGQVGVRPEHIPLQGEGTAMTASLQHIERLGDSSLLYVQIPGQAIATVKVEGSASLAAGSALTLRLQADQLHLFDSAGLACHRTVQLPE